MPSHEGSDRESLKRPRSPGDAAADSDALTSPDPSPSTSEVPLSPLQSATQPPSTPSKRLQSAVMQIVHDESELNRDLPVKIEQLRRLPKETPAVWKSAIQSLKQAKKLVSVVPGEYALPLNEKHVRARKEADKLATAEAKKQARAVKEQSTLPARRQRQIMDTLENEAKKDPTASVLRETIIASVLKHVPDVEESSLDARVQKDLKRLEKEHKVVSTGEVAGKRYALYVHAEAAEARWQQEKDAADAAKAAVQKLARDRVEADRPHSRRRAQVIRCLEAEAGKDPTTAVSKSKIVEWVRQHVPDVEGSTLDARVQDDLRDLENKDQAAHIGDKAGERQYALSVHAEAARARLEQEKDAADAAKAAAQQSKRERVEADKLHSRRRAQVICCLEAEAGEDPTTAVSKSKIVEWVRQHVPDVEGSTLDARVQDDLSYLENKDQVGFVEQRGAGERRYALYANADAARARAREEIEAGQAAKAEEQELARQAKTTSTAHYQRRTKLVSSVREEGKADPAAGVSKRALLNLELKDFVGDENDLKTARSKVMNDLRALVAEEKLVAFEAGQLYALPVNAEKVEKQVLLRQEAVKAGKLEEQRLRTAATPAGRQQTIVDYLTRKAASGDSVVQGCTPDEARFFATKEEVINVVLTAIPGKTTSSAVQSDIRALCKAQSICRIGKQRPQYYSLPAHREEAIRVLAGRKGHEKCCQSILTTCLAAFRDTSASVSRDQVVKGCSAGVRRRFCAAGSHCGDEPDWEISIIQVCIEELLTSKQLWDTGTGLVHRDDAVAWQESDRSRKSKAEAYQARLACGIALEGAKGRMVRFIKDETQKALALDSAASAKEGTIWDIVTRARLSKFLRDAGVSGISIVQGFRFLEEHDEVTRIPCADNDIFCMSTQADAVTKRLMQIAHETGASAQVPSTPAVRGTHPVSGGPASRTAQPPRLQPTAAQPHSAETTRSPTLVNLDDIFLDEPSDDGVALEMSGEAEIDDSDESGASDDETSTASPQPEPSIDDPDDIQDEIFYDVTEATRKELEKPEVETPFLPLRDWFKILQMRGTLRPADDLARLKEILESDPVFMLDGDHVTLRAFVELAEEETDEINWQDSDDENDPEIDTEIATVETLNTLEFFEYCQAAFSRNDVAVAAELRREFFSVLTTPGATPIQKRELRKIYEDALCRVPFLDKSLLPGDRGFNSHATDVMRNPDTGTRVAANPESFQMVSSEMHLLTCSTCNKRRDVGPGPVFYKNVDGTEWTCRSEGSPVTGCDEPESIEESNRGELQPYQKTVVYLAHPLSPVSRLLVVHRTGAGKTLTMIRTLENFFFDTRPKIVICPTRATVENFCDELLQWPNMYTDFARKCNGGTLDHKTLLKALTMPRFFQDGKLVHQRRTRRVVVGGVPVPAGPVFIVSYAVAGGETVKKGKRFKVHNLVGDALPGNPYDSTVVLMDEFHNLTHAKPHLRRFEPKLKYLREQLQTAQHAAVYGFTATPVQSQSSDAESLLRIIRGMNPGETNEGFISVFSASPSCLFPKVNPEGVPSFALPTVVEVAMPMIMRQKYASKRRWLQRRVAARLEEIDKADPDCDRLTEQIKHEGAKRGEAVLAPYGTMEPFWTQARRLIKDDGIPEARAAKLYRIADDVLAERELYPDRKIVVFIARNHGFEAMAHIIQVQALKRAAITNPQPTIMTYPPLATGPGCPTPPQRLAAFNEPRNHNGSRIAILIVDSREASEGVSFMATRSLYLAHAPDSWLAFVQLVGRIVRAFSHADLLPNDRDVSVKLYVSTCPDYVATCPCMGDNCTRPRWWCPTCETYTCSKACSKKYKNCPHKLKRIVPGSMSRITTVDQVRLKNLGKVVEGRPPLQALSEAAVDREVLMGVGDIMKDVTLMDKLAHKARFRRLKKKWDAHKKHETEQQDVKPTIAELQSRIEELKAERRTAPAELHQRNGGKMAAGQCTVCVASGCARDCDGVIPCSPEDGPSLHSLCVPCFEEQIFVACDDPESVRSDTVRCVCPVVGGDDDAPCPGSWSFDEALKLAGGRLTELAAKHTSAIKKQIEDLEDALRCQKAEKREVEATRGMLPPSYWIHPTSVAAAYDALPTTTADFSVPISRKDPAWQAIQGALTRSSRVGKLVINELCRVENPFLWQQYQCKVLAMRAMHAMHGHAAVKLTATACEDSDFAVRASLRSDVNEKYLFHGTKSTIVQAVVESGFNERFSNDGKYGHGTYFAENSSKSNQYCTVDSDGHCFMFVARVCLGGQPFTSSQHLQGYRVPPPLHGGPNQRHTSVIGACDQDREFIVYDGMQAYPEYIVKFARQ